jgi:hypothetical protein
LPWVSADDVFAAQDAEEEALRAAPWLLRGRGPLRKPEEGGFNTRIRKLTVEERLRLNAASIRESEQAIREAGPDADVFQLNCRLRAFRGARVKLLQSRAQAS